MLSDCKLPFHCTHGRPTMVPLVTLNSTKATSAKEEKLKLWKLKNDDPVPIFTKLDIVILQLSANSKCKRYHLLPCNPLDSKNRLKNVKDWHNPRINAGKNL